MLKLFCSHCHDFIREINPSEANRLKGNETCKMCRDKAMQFIEDFEKLYKAHSSELNKVYNSAILALEELKHRVFDG